MRSGGGLAVSWSAKLCFSQIVIGSATAYASRQQRNSPGLTRRRQPARERYAGVGLAPLLLDHVPDHRRDVRPAEPGNGADAGRRGDVDLGEIAVDDVDA